MRRHIVFTAICFWIVLVFTIAYISPFQDVQSYVPVGDSFRTLTKSDISLLNNCEINSSGEIIITGEDPYIVFEQINEDIGGAALYVEGQFQKNVSGQLYIDCGEGFSEEDSKCGVAFSKSSFLCFSLSRKNVQSIRLDLNNNTGFIFCSLELYEQVPKLEWVKIESQIFDVFLAIAVALVIAGIVFLLDLRTDVSLKAKNVIKNNYLKVLFFISGSVVLCLLGLGVEYVLGHYVFGGTMSESCFNRYRCIFICHIFLVIYAFIWFRKDIGKKPEKAFLAIMFITGSMMILDSPFGWNSWDVGIHYRWASNASYFKEANVTMADYLYDEVDELVNVKENLEQNEKAIERMNGYYNNVIAYRPTETTIAHRFSGLAMSVARMVGCSFYEIYLIGEYVILFIYTVVCFLAMRKLNSGKMILAVIALLPTSMFLATNYSYDYWVICFSMLGMAYFLSELQKPEEPISVRNTLIMSGAFAIASLPKLIYATLLIIPFFMKKKNWTKKERKKYYVICGCVIIALAILFAIVALQKVGGTGDMRGGTGVNPAEQIHYILSTPLTYAKDLLGFLGYYYLSYKAMSEYFVHFAYLGMGVGTSLILGLLIFVTMTDKNKYDTNSSSWFVRIGNLIVFGGSVILIATALYIDYTPVASQFFQGCQPRYLIPLLFPVLSVVGFFKPISKLNRTWYNGIVMGIMVGLIYCNVAILMLPRLM